MKRLLSVLCMAILAGGMIFTSCTKTWTITVESNNEAWGTVTGGGSFNDQATATLTATPKAGYEFEKWQDGNTQNPRTITVTANETYTAYFKVAAPEVKVTFNNGVWNAGDISGRYYTGQYEDGSSYAGWVVSAAQTAGSDFPSADVATLTGKSTGSFSDNANTSNGSLTSGDFNYVEYYEETSLSDGTFSYGDWWAKSITLNITAFDATSLTVSANVSATMFSALEAFVASAGQVGVEAASTAPLTENINNITLTSSKGSVKHFNGKKLVAVR